MWQRSKRRGNQFLDRETLGSASLLFIVIYSLTMLLLGSCEVTRQADDNRVPAMALYTPNSDTFAPRSESHSNKMPLPWFYHLSRVRDLGILPQAKLGDL